MQIQEKKMTAESLTASCSAALLLLVGYAAATSASVGPASAQITVLYDAFGQTSAMQKDWGYAVLVEYGGKRILFDTGNNPDILAQNAFLSTRAKTLRQFKDCFDMPRRARLLISIPKRLTRLSWRLRKTWLSQSRVTR
jgi:hypothetical protein